MISSRTDKNVKFQIKDKRNDPMDALETQAERYLDELFKQTAGKVDNQVSMFDIGAVMGLEKEAARRMAEDLIAEGLVEIKTLSGGIGITPQGIEMAQSMAGGNAGAELTLGKAPVLEEQGRRSLDTVLIAIKNHLAKTPTTFDRLEEVVIDIKTIEVQMLSPRPKTAVIRAVLSSLTEGLRAEGAPILVDNLEKLSGV
jgi:DNA-binding IclR family transcriptional regulator